MVAPRVEPQPSHGSRHCRVQASFSSTHINATEINRPPDRLDVLPSKVQRSHLFDELCITVTPFIQSHPSKVFAVNASTISVNVSITIGRIDQNRRFCLAKMAQEWKYEFEAIVWQQKYQMFAAAIQPVRRRV
ncbi:hypothetical protein KCU81_g630, partial [Aureobasidium melanogenum]